MADGMSAQRGVVASLVFVCALLGACAARTPARSVAAPPAPSVDRLVHRGCYACLEEAFATASSSGVSAAAFEAAVLLTLRSKELGLPFAQWLERARTLAPREPGWADYLVIAEALPADPLSADRDAILVMRRPVRGTIEGWRQALSSGPGSGVFRAHLDLALVCGPTFVTERGQAITAALDRFPGVPLVAYRAGLCGRTSLLTDLLEEDAAFTDVYLELGRAAL